VHSTPFNAFILASAMAVAAVALFSRPIQRYISPPLIALALGVALAWGLPGSVPNLSTDEVLVEQVSRITLAIALMAAAIRIKKSIFSTQWTAGAVMIGLAMPLMWMFSALIVKLVLGISWLHAFLVGATVTPTDPVAAASIITGQHAERHAPESLRTLVSLESGANDGLSYLFVYIPILLLTRPASEAATELVITTFLREILGGAIFGLIVGHAAGRLAGWAAAHEHPGKAPIFVFSSALALSVLAAAELLGLNAVLAVFVAGVAFNFTEIEKGAASPENVQGALDLLFTVPTFVLIGIALPWHEWFDLGWKALALPLALFLLRRFPAVLALGVLLSKWHNGAARVILAWAGPIGTAGAFYAMLTARLLDWPDAWVYASLAIASSVLLHGLTAPHVVAYFGKEGKYAQMYE
jgi:NhaP-type Na+/H+ or K+/H+ antiporter